MEDLSKEQYEELESISKQITLLKMQRIEKFGKNWQLKLNRYGTKRRVKPITNKDVINKHLRQMDETMVLKGYTIGKLCGLIGISRNVYSDMRNGYLSNRVNCILSNLNWDNL